MATAVQLKALIQSHFEDDNQRFMSVAMQLAAHEARQGHRVIASEIRELIDNNRTTLKVVKLNQNLEGLIEQVEPRRGLKDLILEDATDQSVKQVLFEYANRDKLAAHNLSFKRKLLFAGPPGTGKSLTSEVIAKETNLPFFVIQTDRLITKYIGETSTKLRSVFSGIAEVAGVYLFDEFDTLGADRNNENEVGEMRRVLNSFLQFIESDRSQSFVVCATNNLNLLDFALFRRFDEVVNYEFPSKSQIQSLIYQKIGAFITNEKYSKAIHAANSLTHAEIVIATEMAIKNAILHDKNVVMEAELVRMINLRKKQYNHNPNGR